MDKRKLHVLILILNLSIALFLVVFFWFYYSFESNKTPTFIMILALVYILIEMLKKNYLKIDFIWNRLYYIGLFAIIIPVAFADKLSIETIKYINQFGVLFLLSPFIIETYHLKK